MTKERLSKLQKEILTYMASGETYYRYILSAMANKFGKTFDLRDYPIDESFRSVFSQSVRNLEKKGLVKLKFENPRSKLHKVKICKGRHPESEKPCKDCPYLKKYNIEPRPIYGWEDGPFSVAAGRCWFSKKQSEWMQIRKRVMEMELIPESNVRYNYINNGE